MTSLRHTHTNEKINKRIVWKLLRKKWQIKDLAKILKGHSTKRSEDIHPVPEKNLKKFQQTQ